MSAENVSFHATLCAIEGTAPRSPAPDQRVQVHGNAGGPEGAAVHSTLGRELEVVHARRDVHGLQSPSRHGAVSR